MLRRKLLMAVAAAAVAGLLGPASARAGFTFTVSDGTTTTGPLNQGDVVNLDGFRITVNGDENSPGTTSGSSGFVTNQSTVKIDPLSASTSPVTFTITSEATGFTVAPGPYTVTSALAASSLIDGGKLEGRSTLNGSLIGGSFTTISSITATDQTTVSGLTASTPFSLGNEVRVILPATTNQGNSTAAAYTFTTTVTAAPAPATAILALAGAPIFGVFGWMRRRKAVVA